MGGIVVWAFFIKVSNLPLSKKEAKNVSWPWLSLLRELDSLTTVFLGNLGYIYIYIYIHIYTYICECVCVVWKYSLNRYLVKGCWWLFLYFRVLVNTYADTLEVNMTNYPQNITRKPVSLRTGGTTTEKNVCS